MDVLCELSSVKQEFDEQFCVLFNYLQNGSIYKKVYYRLLNKKRFWPVDCAIDDD